jgi:preprotein translocase subunit YajC
VLPAQCRGGAAGKSRGAAYGIIARSKKPKVVRAVFDWFISSAYAQQAAAGAPNPAANAIVTWLPLLLIPVFYFVLIRPQQKRAKEQRDMLGKLAKGDEVVINGGLAGRITHIGEAYLTLEVADKVEVKVQKSAISSVLPKGSLKNL